MWDPPAVDCAWDDRREEQRASRRCGGFFPNTCNESIDWAWRGEAESRPAFPSVNHPPVLPIWRKNEAAAAPQFGLSAGRSRSRLQPSRLLIFTLFAGSLIVSTDALQRGRDFFYEAEWDVGWNALLAPAAVTAEKQFISLLHRSTGATWEQESCSRALKHER